MNGDSLPPLGAILAGGKASRLGRPKATAELAGRPLIGHALAVVVAAGLEPVVVAKDDSRLPPLACPVVTERSEPQHPLCGIVAALEHAEASVAGQRHRWRRRPNRAVVVIACDMPNLPPAFLSWLGGQPVPLLIPEIEGRLQPLAGRYDTRLLPCLRDALTEDPGPLHRVIAGLRPRTPGLSELSRFGDPLEYLHNVNTPEDLARAERLLAPGPTETPDTR